MKLNQRIQTKQNTPVFYIYDLCIIQKVFLYY